MPVTVLIVNQIIIVLLLIIIGIICYKLKVISYNLNKQLSALVLNLVNPTLILISYQKEFNEEYLKGLADAFILAIVSYAIAIIISQILIRKSEKNEYIIERFSCIYSNCGFMGIPLVNGIFGSEGVFYLTAFITMFNILIWTHGVMIMKGEKSVQYLGKIVKTPAIIATVVGFIFFVFKIMLPDILFQTLNSIGSMNTPLAMLVAGVTIAQTNIIHALKNKRIYYIAFLKLLFIPLISLIVLKLFDVNTVVLITTLVAVSSPTAATATLFALSYGRNDLYASEIFAVTTFFSVVTLPLMIYIVSII